MIWTHGLINRLVMTCDGLMIIAGIIIAHTLHPFGTLLHLGLYALFYVIIYIWIMKFGGVYRVEHYLSVLRQLRQVTVGALLAGFFMSIIDGALLSYNSTALTAISIRIAIIWAMILAGRLTVVRACLWWAERKELLVRKVVIVGAADNIVRTLTLLRQSQQHLYKVIGIFPLAASEINAESPQSQEQDDNLAALDVPILGTSNNLIPYMLNNPIDMVFLSMPWRDVAVSGDLIEKLGSFSIDAFIPLEEGVFAPHFAQVTNIVGMGALQVIRRPLKGSRDLIKIIEDYVVATIGLIVSMPILLIAAIAIKLETPGPVFFRQARVGFNNRLFNVFKLRTMKYDPTDDGSRGTERDDPRITRVGAVLRKLSIDELPQLINVLRGEMSVVGPRPHVPNMQVGDDCRYDTVRAYTHRYQMKPGITGWAQINGMRGGIHTQDRAKQGVNLDLYYIENWSLWLDIKIMLLTVTKGMAGSDIF